MKNLLISFSGGRTSAFMSRYLQLNDLYKNHKKYFIFMNTSKEKEETLEFVNECDKRFKLNVIYLEAIINPVLGQGNDFKITDFKNLKRKGEIFEDGIKKYGIPNVLHKWCSRVLKKEVFDRFTKKHNLLNENSLKAIGVRYDEKQRLSYFDKNLFYPLADEIQATKSFINNWWRNQDFNLNLKEYEGNCDLCYKKSERKLLTIIKENPFIADWWHEMEEKYSYSEEHEKSFYFYRNNTSTKELIEKAKNFSNFAKDEKFHQITLQDYILDSELSCLCGA